MSYQCQFINLPSRPVLSIRTVTSMPELPQVIGKAYAVISGSLGELREEPAGPPFAAYFNMDMQNLDVEMGFPITKQLPGKGDIQPGEIPGGKVATCVHTGPYSEIAPAYEALTQYVHDNGFETTGVAYEMYLNDPAVTPPPEVKTQIVFPLK
jgi:effector-binding domain-containing protein